MSVAADLAYRYGDRNGFQRSVASFFASRPGAWLGKWLVPLFDDAVLKLTSGKSTISDWFGGLPPLWLTTTGAKTGEQRRHPLFGFPVGDHLAVIGSNFGQARHPAWVYNLEAHPDATVEYQGTAIPVVGRSATEDEAAEVWKEAALVYPGYSKYRRRAQHREIRVFILEAH